VVVVVVTAPLGRSELLSRAKPIGVRTAAAQVLIEARLGSEIVVKRLQ
jgi:hypothetical protein